MSQLPFAVTCGVRTPIVPHCPDGFHTEIDLDGSGAGIQYGLTQIFSPCKPAIVDTKAPPNLKNSLTWNPTRRTQGTGVQADAADPYIVNPGSLPLPPHCYGWDGSTDFDTETYYPLGTTLLQIVDSVDEFAAINSVRVQVDYDVRVQRRFDQRKLVFTRANFFSSFDFTTPTSDTCTSLSSSDVTTHHTDQVYEAHGGALPSDSWNSFDLVLADKQSARKQSDGSFLTNYAWHSSEWKDSSYLDPAFVSDSFDLSRWGRFSFGQAPGNGLEMWAIYKFGQEIQTVSNVRYTISCGWIQYHCKQNDTMTGPCNCNDDCPPCQGVGSVGSGRCATICANGGVSSTMVQGFHVKDQFGNEVGSTADTRGWTVSVVNRCALRVCVPCLTAAQLAANTYQGPYTATWGDSGTCVCNNLPWFKVFTATFTVFADVICKQEEPPKPGQSVSYDVSDSRRHVRAFTTLKPDNITPDKVHVGLASNVIPLVWKDVTTDVIAKRFCIRWDRQSLGSSLYGLAEGVNVAGGEQHAGQIHLYQSIDEGNTWTYKFRVDEGNHPDTRPVLLIARDGRRFCFWFQLGLAGVNGSILMKTFDAAWNVIEPTKVIFDVAEDDDFNVDEYVGRDGEWSLPAWYTISGAHLHPTGFVARDGRRFYYFNSGGQVQFYVLDAAGNSIQGTRVISNLGAVDDAQIAVDETVGADLAWYVTLVYRSGGQIACKSSKGGIVFA